MFNRKGLTKKKKPYSFRDIQNWFDSELKKKPGYVNFLQE